MGTCWLSGWASEAQKAQWRETPAAPAPDRAPRDRPRQWPGPRGAPPLSGQPTPSEDSVDSPVPSFPPGVHGLSVGKFSHGWVRRWPGLVSLCLCLVLPSPALLLLLPHPHCLSVRMDSPSRGTLTLARQSPPPHVVHEGGRVASQCHRQ